MTKCATTGGAETLLLPAQIKKELEALAGVEASTTTLSTLPQRHYLRRPRLQLAM